MRRAKVQLATLCSFECLSSRPHPASSFGSHSSSSSSSSSSRRPPAARGACICLLAVAVLGLTNAQDWEGQTTAQTQDTSLNATSEDNEVNESADSASNSNWDSYGDWDSSGWDSSGWGSSDYDSDWGDWDSSSWDVNGSEGWSMPTTTTLPTPPPDFSPLQEWLNGLVVKLPAGLSGELPQDMGNLTLHEGSVCWGAKLARLDSEDLSTKEVLRFRINLQGYELKCHVVGDNDGKSLEVNITIGASKLDFTAQIQPYYSPFAPQFPLPLGMLNLTSCESDFKVTDVAFSGTSMVAELMNDYPEGNRAMIVGDAANLPICDGMAEAFAGQGSNGFRQSAEVLSAMLAPPVSLATPSTPLKAPLNWDEYPPTMVLESMLAERFHLWADRIVELLNTVSFNSKLIHQDGVTLTMEKVAIQGVGPRHRPGLSLEMEKQHFSALVNLSSLTLFTKLGLEVELEDQPRLSKKIDISMGLDNISAGARAWVDREVLDSLDMDQVVQNPQCILECTEGIADPQSDTLAVVRLGARLSPVFGVASEGSLEMSISQLINNIVRALYIGYMPAITKLIDNSLAAAREPLNLWLWDHIEALPPCSYAAMFMRVSQDIITGLWSAAFALFGLGLLAAVSALPPCSYAAMFMRVSQESPDRSLDVQPSIDSDATDKAMVAVATSIAEESPDRSLDVQPSIDSDATNKAMMAVAASIAEESPDRSLDVQPSIDSDATNKAMMAVATSIAEDKCLALQPFVPPALRVFYPICLVATMFLFLFADLDIGATVSLVTLAQGSSTTIGPIFTFSLLSTVVHSWESGAYIISVITLVTSGIWPFVKLGMLLACWIVSPKRLGWRTRSRILQFLDRWGKYSYVDSWFLVLSMSAFALDWQAINSNDSLKVQTLPTTAFYGYFAATSISIILGLVANDVNMKVHARAAIVADPSMVPQPSLELASEGKSIASLVPWRVLRWIVSISIVTGFLAAATGIFAMSFTFEVAGLATEFLFGGVVHKRYSLYTVGTSVGQGRWSDFGLVGLELVFITLAIVIPLVELVVMALVWFLQLRIPTQRWLLSALHVLDAWSSLDVAVVVLVISCFEFSTMAEFLIQKSGFAAPCNLIKDLTQAECLDVHMTPLPLMSALSLAGAILLLLPKLILRLAPRLLEQRLRKLGAGQQAMKNKVSITAASAPSQAACEVTSRTLDMTDDEASTHNETFEPNPDATLA